MNGSPLARVILGCTQAGVRPSPEHLELMNPHLQAAPSAVDGSRPASDPGASRILVAITAHYLPSRVIYLSQVLRSFAAYPVADLHVCIFTTGNTDEQAILARLARETLQEVTFEVVAPEALQSTLDLPWSSKELITSRFMKDGYYSHFIYVEDDLPISYENFCYFLDGRERLRDIGLLPSFLRVEYNDSLLGFVSLDNSHVISVSDSPHVIFDDFIFTNVPNPYCACFILDQELAVEYAGSASFDQVRSASVYAWGVLERAAMGLCFENIPAGFRSRWVIPVSRRSGLPASRAWIPHLPNNYTNQEDLKWAKTRMDSLIGDVTGLD